MSDKGMLLVSRGDRTIVGSCNFCHTLHWRLWVVEGKEKTLVVRFCDACRNEFVRKTRA